MKCHEAKRRLDPFMDGELAMAENLSVLEHLNLCSGCADVFEGEKRLRAELKASLGAARAPAGLEARLRSALRPPSPAFRRGWLAAAALLVAFVGVFLLSGGTGPGLLASELSARHAAGEAYACHEGSPERRCLCPGCTPDAAPAIHAFFAGRAPARDYCAHLTEGTKLGYVLQGVAAWRCRGQEIYWSTWRTSAGARVSHALLAVDPPLRAPRLEREEGRTLLFYPKGSKGNVACVFIFDAPAEAGRFMSELGLPKP